MLQTTTLFLAWLSCKLASVFSPLAATWRCSLPGVWSSPCSCCDGANQPTPWAVEYFCWCHCKDSCCMGSSIWWSITALVLFVYSHALVVSMFVLYSCLLSHLLNTNLVHCFLILSSLHCLFLLQGTAGNASNAVWWVNWLYYSVAFCNGCKLTVSHTPLIKKCGS